LSAASLTVLVKGAGFPSLETFNVAPPSAASTPTTPQHVLRSVGRRPNRHTHHPPPVKHPPASSTLHQNGSHAPPSRAYAGQAHRPQAPAVRAARKWFAKAPAPRLASGELAPLFSANHFAFFQVSAKPRLQASNPLFAYQQPQFQRPKSPPERQSPIPQDSSRAHPRPIASSSGLVDITRTRCSAFADVIQRAIKRRPQPLMSIDNQRVGPRNAIPHPAAFRQDHRRPGHCRINMNPD